MDDGDLGTVNVRDLDVKISDFGFARQVPLVSFTLSRLGTLLYMAPEVVTGRYSKPADIYAVGVITLELLLKDLDILQDKKGEHNFWPLKIIFTSCSDLVHLQESTGRDLLAVQNLKISLE